MEPAPPAYATQMRERCRPLQCTQAARCWVAHGTSDTLLGYNGSPKCKACDGRIREEKWEGPGLWLRRNEIVTGKRPPGLG